MTGGCERYNQRLISIKEEEYDLLSKYQLLKNYSVPFKLLKQHLDAPK